MSRLDGKMSKNGVRQRLMSRVLHRRREVRKEAKSGNEISAFGIWVWSTNLVGKDKC